MKFEWTPARIALYLAGFFGALASIVAVFGLGTYDPATDMLDIHPFNVKWLATQIALWIAPVLATVAAMLGWGKK